jgi:hypothetical protein
MPVLENRKQRYGKAHYPEGTRYAKGNASYPQMVLRGPTDTYALEQAYKAALVAFGNEFGRYPIRERTVIEAMSDAAGLTVTIFELLGGN